MSLFYTYNYYVFLNKNSYYDISFMILKELITLYLHTFCILQIS